MHLDEGRKKAMGELSRRRPEEASIQLAKLSASSASAKLELIVTLLAKLGIRRQAKLDTADYLVLAEDLLKFELHDIAGGLDDLAKYPRRQGETSFPELATLKAVIVDRKVTREAAAERQREAREAEYRRMHPEAFCTFAEVLKEWEAMRAVGARG